MATTRDLFNQLLNPETPLDQKKANLVVASEQKKQNLSALSPIDSYNLGATAQTGLGQASMPTQEQADLLNLAPADIIAKYGQEYGSALLAAKYQGIDQFNADRNATRDMTQASGDLINQTISGFGSAIGGVATLAGGALSDELGTSMASGMSQFDEAMRSVRSDASQASARVLDTTSDLRGRDSAVQYQEDVANGVDPLVAGISRFGSDFVGGVSDVVSDPTQFADMAAQGVGSMAAIPVIAAGLTAASPAALSGAGVTAAASVLGATKKAVRVGRAIEAALAPTLAIGAVEGGSTYQQTANKITNTSFEELAATSQEYNDKVASGLSPAAARTQLAGETAMLSAGIQAPAAILAGSLVSKFAAAPIANRSVKEALTNTGKEFLEEAAQSGSSQLASNTALATNVDPNTDLLEGVGSAAGQGAVAGLATAGAMQTPGVIGQAGSDAMAALDEQVGKLKTKNEKASPVADEAVAEAAASIQTAAPEVAAAVADNPELAQLVTDITESAINFDGEAVSMDESVPAIVRSAAKGQVNQIGFLQALARSSTDASLSEADRAVALMAVKSISGQLNDYMGSLNESLVDLEPEHPVRKFAAAINEMSGALNASPAMTASEKSVEPTLKAAVENNPITEQADESAVSVHLAAAELAPQTTTAEGVNTLLKMASAGKIQLTDEQKFNLQMLSKLHQNAKEYDQTMMESGNATAQDAVSMEIKTGTTGADGSMSVMQHAQGIRQALARGDTEDARSRLEDLGMFAQHMQNKVAAINSHMEQDKPTFQTAPSYQKLVGTRGNRSFVDSGRNKQGVTPSSETSVRHAQMVNAEANFVTKSYNSLVEIFDTLGLAPMQKMELDSRLRGNAAQVASEFASGSRTAGKPKAKTKPVLVNTGIPTVSPRGVVADTLQVGDVVDNALGDASYTVLSNTPGVGQERNISIIYEGERNATNTTASELEPVIAEGATITRAKPAPAKAEPVQKKAASEATDLSSYTNHSGGAKGSDSVWDIVGRSFGLGRSLHYYGEGSKTPLGNTPLTPEQLAEADPALIRANKSLGRHYPPKNAYVRSLLQRNYYQVRNSDAVYAIGSIADKLVEGGTGWAVQMAIDMAKPVYVFNQKDNLWYTFSNGQFVQTATPALTKNFAGVGTREITEAGERAIRKVYEKTVSELGKAPASVQESKQQATADQPAAPAATEEFAATMGKAIKGMDDATITRRINALMGDLINEESPRKLMVLDMLTAERDARAQLNEPVEAESEIAQESSARQPDTAPISKQDKWVQEGKAELKNGVYYINEPNLVKNIAGTNGRDVYVDMTRATDPDQIRGYLIKGSEQKARMLEVMGITAEQFLSLFTDSNGAIDTAAFIDFLIAHEKSHVANNDYQKYPKIHGKWDLMDEVAIAIEVRATEDAFTPEQRAKYEDMVGSNEATDASGKPLPPDTITENMEDNPLFDVYPNLVGGESNLFVTSYKLPMNPISNLDGVTTPISQVYNQLKSTIDDQGAIRAFQEVFRDFPNVLNYLNSNLGDLLRKKRNGKTLRELALQGNVRELTYYPEARSAALAEVNGDQVTFNTELVAKAYLAGISWLMNGMNFIGATDIERIARAFRIPETEVTQEQVTALSNGVTRIQAIDALSSRIQQFWGVTPNGSAIDGYTKGIVQSMAANIIDTMTNMTFPMVDDQGNQVDVPVLTKTKLDISSTDNGPKSLDVFTPFSFSGTSLANYRSAIDKIVLTNPEEVVYLGSNVPAPATTQMHNPQVKNTPEQIEMLKNQNATSYYLNPETLSIYDAMGVDALVDLFGEGQLNEAVLNKNDFASREGRNLNIIASWNMAKEVIFNMQNFADDEGIELTEVPVHYAHNITSVGRAQQLGRYTPQSSKLMRTLLLPTVSKPLDLTQPGQDYTAFMLGLGQSLGVKVHNFGPDVTEAKVMDMVNGKYAPVIEILRGHLDGTGSISADNLATFKEVLGQPTFETFQGLVEYARFLNTEDKSNYVTQLYLEADGMSNGPFNSIAMLSTGKFTVDQLNNMAKCGLYLGNDNFSNVSWVKRVKDPVDLYETVSNRTKANMDIAAQAVEAQARSTNKKSANDARAYQTLQNHMNRLMGILLDDAVLVEKEDGSTELLTKRGISKNPTTVTTYGSGKAGIANKVINAMLENLYRRISDALEANAANPNTTVAQGMFPNDPDAEKKVDDLDEAIRALTGQRAYISRKTGFGAAKADNAPEQVQISTDYTMSSAAFATLSGNVRNLFVESMNGAIQETIGEGVSNSVDNIRQMTQLQSIILANAYAKRVNEVLPKPGTEGYVQGGYLSRKQQVDIFNSLMPLSPFIEGNNQIYYIAGSDKVDMSNTIPYGASLNDKVSAAPTVNAPANAGVKGIATMVIGNGDGKTIQLTSQDPKNTERAVFIFDGINFPLDYIREGSRAANKAALEAVLGNPMANALKSFQATVSELTGKVDSYLDFNDEFKMELAKVIHGPAVEKEIADALTPADLLSYASQLDRSARNDAAWIEARHAVLNQVNLGMDQMAAAGAPYTVDNKVQLSGSMEEISTQLNTMLDAELTKAKARFDAESKSADIKRREKKISVATDVAGFGIEQPSGVRIVAGGALASMLAAVSREIPRYQSVALQTAIKNLVAEGYKVVHGTYDQLATYNESLGANAIDMSSVDQFSDQGLTNPHSREIWLLNPTAEVLVHEAIHASTFMSLLSYYNGEGTVSSAVAGSIEAIEGLMNQFLELDQVDLAPYRDAVAAINGALNNSSLSLAERKAQAVNEYMAWGLANKELAQAQAKVPVSITTLVWETIQKVRNWLFGNTGRNTDDMLSNLVFHTKVIMGETQPTLSAVSNTNTLMMTSYGKNQRMADLSRMIQKKVGQYVNTGTRVQAAKSKTVAAKASINAFHMRGLFAANGFPMSMEESATFHKIVAILGTQVQLDSGVMTRLQELYAAATKDMTVETFMDDPQSTNPNDFAAAQKRFDVVMGKKGIGRDTMGRSTLLPSFVALALTNDRFRKILADMPVPRTEQSNQARTMDAWLENTANSLLDKMGDLVSGQKTAPNIVAAIDSLADQLMSIEKETAGFYTQQLEAAGSLSDRANDRIVKGMSQLGEKLGKTAEARKAAGKNTTLLDSLANNSLTLASSILSEERAGFVAEAVIAGVNSAKLPKWLHDILADMIGRVDSNANVYDLIKKVRSSIQRVRNQFRTELPKTLAKHFTRPVTSAEWALMNSAIGKTDLVSLVLSGQFTRKEAINALTGQTALNKAIRAAELEVVQMAGRNGNEMLSRSSQLAKFMMTGIPGQNLARNANAIARRLGMRNPAQSLDKALAERIDALTTLYAVDLLTDAQKSGMAALLREQAAGVDFVFDYAQAMSQEEIAREKNSLMGQATYNRYKGHMPQLAQEGVSLVIASDSEYAKLAERSYIRIGGYNTSSLEANGAAMGYYYAPVSGRAQFNQGILQNVRQTVGGVDNLTGYTVGSLTAGRIIDPAQVKKIAALQAAGRYVEGGTNLMPVFSPSGAVVAYERSADPRALASLNHSENYAELLGVWKGRLAEEMLAEESNTVAVEQLAEMYRKDMNKSSLNKSQYVNLFDMGFQDKNPVVLDALKLFTPSTVDLINASFPNGEFWVRKDMLDNVIGYRSATVGDAWTGNSYWSSQTQENIRKVAMTVFGNKAFQYMVNAESLLQGVVQDARTLIVVKSMVVPLANFMSNLLQLIARGVPVRSIVAGMPKKLAEVRQYVAAEKRAIEAEAELHAATDPIKQRRLRVEIQSIRDSFKRMSIYPLIERGELSSMSDDAQPEDQELTAGRLSQFIEAQVNKLPPAIRTAGKYALITKDTALYKGLRKSVEYGDFLAKAIMWDDLTQRQGKTPEYAGSKITEEFVNYDRLGGRNRQYLEDVGLMWFYNFKIRSAKVALSMMRNNPLHVLMAAAVPVPGVFGSVGSPITDNVLSKMMEGSLDNSLGLDQLFAAPMLHPIENLVF